jgi:hypothetical protein
MESNAMNSSTFDELPDDLKGLSKRVDFNENKLATGFDDLPDELRQISRDVNLGGGINLGQQVREAAQFGARGFGEGAATLGSVLDLAGLQAPGLLPGEEQRIAMEAAEPAERPSFASMLGDDDIMPPTSRIASAKDVRGIAELLGVPEEPETFGGRAGRRLGRATGAAASFGGAGLPLFAGSAAAGQVAEELTGSELAGDITEIVATFRPNRLFAKKVPAGVGVRAGRGSLGVDPVKVGRSFGLTEQEVATISQDPRRLKALMKLGSRGAKTEKLANSIEAKLGDAYGKVKVNARQFPNISGRAKQEIIATAETALRDLKKTVAPSDDKKKAIEFLDEAVKKLEGSEVDPEMLMNWWQDINKSINWKKLGVNKSAVSLKDPIVSAIDLASPQLAQDFESLNQLQSNFYKIADSLKPDTIDRMVKLGEGAALVGAVFTLNPVAIGSVFLGVAGRRAMTEMATNPRYINLLRKGAKALADQKQQKVLQVGRKLTEMMTNDFGEEAFDEELLNQMFNSQK